MNKCRMQHVKHHFEAEAGVFDARIVTIVPHYREMLEALVTALPFSSGKGMKVADLGCGTGTVAYLIKKRYPGAHITCVDLSRNMLELAAKKLRGLPGIVFEASDIGTYRFKNKYDAVVSSLAMHHTQPGKEKAAIYKNIYGALKKGGAFINADIIISPDKAVQKKYLAVWARFILKTYSQKQNAENYRRYKREDRPASLSDEIAALDSAGFRYVEMIWKHYNFATYMAIK